MTIFMPTKRGLEKKLHGLIIDAAYDVVEKATSHPDYDPGSERAEMASSILEEMKKTIAEYPARITRHPEDWQAILLAPINEGSKRISKYSSGYNPSFTDSELQGIAQCLSGLTLNDKTITACCAVLEKAQANNDDRIQNYLLQFPQIRDYSSKHHLREDKSPGGP